MGRFLPPPASKPGAPLAGCRYNRAVLHGLHSAQTRVALALIVAALGAGNLCQAAAEEEWQLGLSAGAAAVSAQGDLPLGALLGADAQRGLTDTWALRGSIEGARHQAASDSSNATSTANATAGLTYSLDVLRVLPFAEISLCALRRAAGTTQRSWDVGLQTGLGADYLLNRRYSVGIIARYAFLPVELHSNGTLGRAPHLATVSLRFSYRLL